MLHIETPLGLLPHSGGPETGFEEVDRIRNERSARIYQEICNAIRLSAGVFPHCNIES
jgi:hypothetical protein